ncbi:site-specific integrase [archaeon]|jgi:integrase|nr:site-specific integrase [archaeon]
MSSKKVDPHKHEHYYRVWKEKLPQQKDLAAANKKHLLNYLADMEVGKNVSLSSKKGARSFGRLRNQGSKLYAIFRLLQIREDVNDVAKVTEDQLLKFFNDMSSGKVKSLRTKAVYTQAGNYVKSFKAFWHWYQIVQHKAGKPIPDITNYLDSKVDKPKFNYFTLNQLKILCDNSKLYYKTLMMFMFDSGIRSPTELMNVRLKDLEWLEDKNRYQLDIRAETSKTFGRKIKLMLCSPVLKQYIKQENLKPNDYLFAEKTRHAINSYLREIGFNLLGIGKQSKKKLAGGKTRKWVSTGLTMYDFRHSSACYWIKIYKTQSAILYRFGWKKMEMLLYYTEFMGMTDTIQDEDLYVDISKTELEKQIAKVQRNAEIQEQKHQAEMDATKKLLAAQEKRMIAMFKKMVKSKKINSS